MASFFHFGRSADDSEADYFVFIGSTTRFLFPLGLTKRFHSGVLEAINADRTNWFAFNSHYDWFSFFNASSHRLGSSKSDWSGNLNRDLSSFLSANLASSPRVVFGPDGTCLAWTLRQPDDRLGAPRSAGRWLDHGQKAEMDRLLKYRIDGISNKPVQFAALGVRGTYFIQFDDGEPPVYDFKRYYPSLAQYAERRRMQVMFLALHPQDPNQYFLVETNGNVRARVSPRIYAELKPAMNKEKIMNDVVIDVSIVPPTRLVSYRVTEMHHSYSYP